ncbi:MAG: hypothetical protein N2V74_00060 [Candidatus Methanospirare jalkutatii]|nr:MAG: hypothetical protein N2V74_05790 [Candidatus Methanospirare jalkutatii]UYZ40131.1 MAG: hypothetical protein N2V74_00060 [Candidatus Methanospirare jalkutatii]
MAEEEEEIGERLRRICGILERAYGEKAVEPRNPVEVLVRTILSQNTNEKNTEEAFKSLTARFKYEELLTASEEEIADAIRKGGLGRIKARRLKTALSALKNAAVQRSGMQRSQRNDVGKGDFNFHFLEDMEVEEAREFLTSIPGIGQKTASCVLCFAFRKKAFPVDTHIRRIFSRVLGIHSPREIARLVERSIRSSKIVGFHLNLIEHGRRVCKPQRPKCEICVLQEVCEWWKSSEEA